MTLAIRINVDSSLDPININDLDDTIRRNSGHNRDEYNIMEIVELEYDRRIIILACNTGGFNLFEFLYGNYRGIVFVVLQDTLTQDFLNISIQNFLDIYYEEDDLGDYSDRNSYDSDSYDYDDDFIDDDRT